MTVMNYSMRIIALFFLFLCAYNADSQNMFRNSPNHSGVYSGSEHTRFGDTLWTFRTSGPVHGSATIDGTMVFIGSGDGFVYAVNKESGKTKWKFKTSGPVHSTPAVYGNAVYITSFDGNLYALDKESGREKWKIKTGGEQWVGEIGYWGMKPQDEFMIDPWQYFLSSPVVDRQTNAIYFGSSDAYLYSADAKTGKINWRFKTEGPIHSSPAVNQNIVFIGSWDTYLYAVDAHTGILKWKFKTGEKPGMTGIQASPSVQNNTVYMGARDANFYALNTVTGEVKWTYDAQGSWILSTAAVTDSVVYTTTSDSFLFVALDASTGKEKFRYKLNGYVYSSPAISGNAAYVGDYTGKLVLLDIKKGELFDQFILPGRNNFAATTLKDDVLDFQYLMEGKDGSLYKTTTDVMEKLHKLGSIVSSAVVERDVVYFGSMDGRLYALKLQ